MCPSRAPRCGKALRGAASALKENGPRFALAGSYALWAFGAPEPSHDVVAILEHSPDDWLFKARTGDTVVDVLHRINGERVERATLDCAEERDVLAIAMPVLPPTMVVIQKLRSSTSITAASRSSFRRCARSASGWIGSTSVPRPPATITPSRFWCWPTGSASPADRASQWLRSLATNLSLVRLE